MNYEPLIPTLAWYKNLLVTFHFQDYLKFGNELYH